MGEGFEVQLDQTATAASATSSGDAASLQPLTGRLSRRRFLELTAAGTATLVLTNFGCRTTEPLYGRQGFVTKTRVPEIPEYRGWEDLYRQKWSWDRVAKGTHGWLNCRSGCEFDLYVRDGVIWREEQSANYPASNDSVPDFNPRGCQKGACYSEVMYGPGRLKYPMKRVGPRGSNQFKRISWDQALTEIADKFLDIIESDGSETIVHDLGPHFDNGPTTAGRVRLFRMMGAFLADDWAEIGDMNMGAAQTFGLAHPGGSSDNWFQSDYLVCWNFNPVVTQIADAHFLMEARYRGATLVCVAPDYSATSIHADLWVNPRPGTDAALALGMARIIIDEDLHDTEYIAEQTDLPFLVRLDTGRFLRESDIVEGGNEERFYVWNRAQGEPALAPGTRGRVDSTLALDGIEPELEGEYSVVGSDGSEIRVTTVFAMLRERLATYTPEFVQEETGIAPSALSHFARGFAQAERAMILSSWGSNRYYHADLMNRSRILLCALTGNTGKPGGGFENTGWFSLEGFEAFSGVDYPTVFRGARDVLKHTDRPFSKLWDVVTRRKSARVAIEELAEDFAESTANMGSSTILNYYHGGLGEIHRNAAYHDPDLPRPVDDYLTESLDKGWMPDLPSRDKTPRAWITGGNNVLRRTNAYPKMMDTLWKDLELIIDINPKITFTGQWADYLLPAAGYYEKVGIKYPVAYVPFLNFCDKAVEPYADSKNEWDISCLLAKKFEERAIARGIAPYRVGNRDFERDPQRFYTDFTMGGKFHEGDEYEVCQWILDHSAAADRVTIDELRKSGIVRYAEVGIPGPQAQIHTRHVKDQPVAFGTDFVEDKLAWPTLTGRQQFLIDHPWYQELDEHLPRHKRSPKSGGDFPLMLTNCHARWSIHSIWRDSPMMLRMQRGEPLIYLGSEDCAKRGLEDEDWVRVFNELGDFEVRLKSWNALQPGQAFMFHAWEPHQFRGHRSHKAITPGMLKPIHMLGDYGHIQWRFGNWQPGSHIQDTRIEVEKVETT